jgi:N-acetylneuraminate synthase
MSTRTEVDEAVTAVRRAGAPPLILLHCTSAYPAQESDANLTTISELRSRFACEVGLSDHTLAPLVAFAATALGVSAIEKHVTLSRAAGGVDAAFSLEPAELAELVAGVGKVWDSLGHARSGPVEAEAASLRERPSIYVVRPMRVGDRFDESNVRIIRPASGLAPKFLPRILGRRCRTEVPEPMPLSWDMVDGESLAAAAQLTEPEE